MIEKLEFYHGAALIRVIEDQRCESVRKSEHGYIVNGDRIILLKYTTKAHSPWRFTFTADDVERFDFAEEEFDSCVLALVCGGDGVCCSTWATVRALLDAAPAWIAAKRGFNGSYALSGPAGSLKRKVPLNLWPEILFTKGAL